MFPKKEPRKENRQVNWDSDKVTKGTWWNGWIAGEMVGVICHWLYRSVPCYFELTDGQLDCPHCRQKPVTHWNGYLPLYKDTHRPTVVVIREVSKEMVERIKIHEPVRVGRAAKDGSAITVVKSKWSAGFIPPKDYAGHPDIRRWLLKLWKEPALEKWVLANPYTGGVKEPATVRIHEMAAQEPPMDEYKDRDLARMKKLIEKEKAINEKNRLPATIGDSLPPMNGTHRKPR